MNDGDELHRAETVVPGESYQESVKHDGTLAGFTRAVRAYLLDCPDVVVSAEFEFAGEKHVITRLTARNLQ